MRAGPPCTWSSGALTQSVSVCLALCGRGMRRALRPEGGLCVCVCLFAERLEPVGGSNLHLCPHARWGLGREGGRPGVRAGARGGGRVVHKTDVLGAL